MAFMQPMAERLSASEAKEYTGDTSACAGWYSRLSAPGYLDCTEWMGPFRTKDEAILEVCDLHECDTDGNAFGDDEYDDAELEEIRTTLAK